MNKIATITMATLLGLATLTTTATAADSINKGQKIFTKKLKGACGFSGVKFAASFKQAEWEAIHKAGKMEEEVKKLCPNLQEWKAKWDTSLYMFGYEYGKDSGNEPAC
ncbi:MAG: Unknown protein [uncultured Sulfurovum sp.]|uniref:Cytochrome C n=1 Tax=uncultured Sulfurovum sp. TaxID=269237 RepID=A0A6S6U4U1_9BACT|nr:MAG: Unknown protein [uncultured Sulfurovum sp.]